MLNKRHIGNEYETKAKEYLKELGYSILSCNFACYMGEIDIVAIDEGYLVFVEVKYRKNTLYGNPIEAINYRKQKKIVNVAKYYMVKNNIDEDTPVRFDVISILGDEISLIKNGFTL